jgi:hypothetical protein
VAEIDELMLMRTAGLEKSVCDWDCGTSNIPLFRASAARNGEWPVCSKRPSAIAATIVYNTTFGYVGALPILYGQRSVESVTPVTTEWS